MNDKKGVATLSGDVIVPCLYEEIYIDEDGYIRVKSIGKFGLRNQEGREIIPCKYDEIRMSMFEKGGYYIVEQNGKKGLYHINKNKELLPCIFDFISYNEKIRGFKVEQNSKYGVYNLEGKEIIPCKYDILSEILIEGFIHVEKNENLGLYSYDGEILIPCKYDFILDIDNGWFLVKQNNMLGFFDNHGKEIVPCIYDLLNTPSEGLILFRKEKDGKFGYMDLSGNVVIKPQYDDANSFKEGIAQVTKDGVTFELQNPLSSSSSGQINGIDVNIPKNETDAPRLFAVVVGNEKYSDETDVPYAENDAKVFKEYCQQTLGVSENHIRYIANAGYNDIRRAVNWLKQGLEAYGGEGSAIFYYAGHGIPDEAQKTAYILPVDGIGSDIESAYSLERLYQTLGEMPAKSITVFLDACFSGAKRDGGMMASARGVAIKTKAEEPKGKMVVFSAAQGDETAYPYKSQQHGMFTYYLLRKLQETKGDVTLGELADYITREVKRQSFDENSRSQTPSIKASASIGGSWRSMKLK